MYKPPVEQVANFIAEGFDQGRSYGSLNTDRAAISLISANRIGNDELLSRTLKGCFRLKPVFPKYSFTWNVDTVLDHLQDLGDSDTLSFKNLTFKLVTLLALATAQRAQTLSLIKLNNIMDNGNQIQIKIDDLIKTSRIGGDQPVLVLPKFIENPKLCIYTCLKLYIRITRDLRKEKSYLFIELKRPHNIVKANTISRWIKTTLDRAGINTSTYTAHSTRSASTSKASSKGIDFDIIRRSASWSSRSQIFAKFYNRKIETNNAEFALAVLRKN